MIFVVVFVGMGWVGLKLVWIMFKEKVGVMFFLYDDRYLLWFVFLLIIVVVVVLVIIGNEFEYMWGIFMFVCFGLVVVWYLCFFVFWMYLRCVLGVVIVIYVIFLGVFFG